MSEVKVTEVKTRRGIKYIYGHVEPPPPKQTLAFKIKYTMGPGAPDPRITYGPRDD